MFIPMGRITRDGRRPAGQLDELSPILGPPAGQGSGDRHHQYAAAECLSGHARHIQLGVSERGARQTHRELGLFLGTTVDQIAAKELGRETQLASLELAMDLNPLAGVCNNGYACVYRIASPGRRRRHRLRRRIRASSSSVCSARAQSGRAPRGAAQAGQPARLFVGDIARLKQRVGVPDRVRLDQYLEWRRSSVRSQRAEQAVADNTTPDLDRPVGVPRRSPTTRS